MNRTVFLHTNGCQRRSLETSRLADYFQKNGYSLIDNPKEAALIIFVSCALDKNHEEESFAFIENYLNKKKNLYLLGCLPAIIPEAFQNRIGNRLKGRVLTTQDLDTIDKFFPEFEIKFADIPESHKLWKRQGSVERIMKNVSFGDAFSKIFQPGYLAHKFQSSRKLSKLESGEEAYLCLSRGCSNSCSYCAKTKAFGKMKSKPLTQCVREYIGILGTTSRRITFTADDTGSYGLDINSSLPVLLSELENVSEGIDVSWSLKNMHPRWAVEYQHSLLPFFEKKLIRELVCPIESGSNRILKKMNRPYQIGEVSNALNSFREANPDLILRTHVMVGFPGETEDDFEATLAAIDEMGFSWVNFFTFFNAENTKASHLKEQIPEDVLQKRLHRMKSFMKKKKIHWL